VIRVLEGTQLAQNVPKKRNQKFSIFKAHNVLMEQQAKLKRTQCSSERDQRFSILFPGNVAMEQKAIPN